MQRPLQQAAFSYFGDVTSWSHPGPRFHGGPSFVSGMLIIDDRRGLSSIEGLEFVPF